MKSSSIYKRLITSDPEQFPTSGYIKYRVFKLFKMSETNRSDFLSRVPPYNYSTCKF